MTELTVRLKESLLEELAEIMLAALKEQGGIYLHADERIKLKEALMSALDGRVRI